MTELHSNSPNLPVEILEHVFAELKIKDIKSVRLASKGLADVGARFLFQPYVFHSDRKDIEKFEEVAKSEDMIAGIKSIRFEIGTMDIYHMSKRLGCAYTREHNNSINGYGKLPYKPNDILLLGKGAATEYAAWNDRWHDANQQYEVQYLRPIFAKLKTLNSIEITRQSTIFENRLLLDAWVMGSRNANFNIAANELIVILEVLAACPHLTLRSFSHDQLPTLFFFRKPEYLRALIAPLSSLEKLHLSFDGTKAPHLKFWKGLKVLLTSLPNLKDLRFGFAPEDDSLHDQSTWINADMPENYYVPLQKLLGDHKWSKLHRLRLDAMMMCETGLTDFLMQHKDTLRSLELYQIGLWQGSFRGLLTCLRYEFKLDTFRMWGPTRGHHYEPEEAWRIHPHFNPFPEYWHPRFLKRMEVASARQGSVRWLTSPPDLCTRLEEFVTSQEKVEWPVEKSDTTSLLRRVGSLQLGSTPRGTHNSPGLSCQHECMRNTLKLIQNWDNTDDDSWVDYEKGPVEGRAVQRGTEEDIRSFDAQGFDENGYNRDSISRERHNHRLYLVRWPGSGFGECISQATGRMLMFDEILMKIPRFSKYMM